MGEENGKVVTAFPTDEGTVKRLTPQELELVRRLHAQRNELHATIVSSTLMIDQASLERDKASAELRELGPRIAELERQIATRLGMPTSSYTITPDGVAIPG